MNDANTNPLRDLTDSAAIAQAFGTKEAEWQRLSRAPQDWFYRELRIPKRHRARRGQYRVVYKITDQSLRTFQKNFAVWLAKSVSFADPVHGFVRGRSIVTNARQHLARKMVVTLDLERFFESISSESVQRSFEELGCMPEAAGLLAALTTRNGVLVQGANASPLIANLAARTLDDDLVALATRHECRYTRYADDLTISGDGDTPSDSDIKAVISSHGFAVRDGTISRQRRGARQYVTGLSTFDGERPRLPRTTKRWLRQVAYYIGKFGVEDHCDRLHIEGDERERVLYRLDGWVRFGWSVEPDFAKRLAAALNGKS